MTNLDYSSEEVMKILNNPDYDESQKKALFEKYKTNLKNLRRKEIIAQVSEVAKNIPTFTEDDYVNFLKKYENDNLSKPFETIKKEILAMQESKTKEYNDYQEKKRLEEEQRKIAEEEATITPINTEEKEELDEIVPDIRTRSERFAEEKPLEQTNLELTVDNSVLNEEPEVLAKPLFSVNESETKEVMPGTVDEPLGEKGNASAIIISIIAIIIGAVAMYTLLKFN